MKRKSKNPITNRYDILFVFDCKDGNPNGDPDSGNFPRIDPDTEQGLVSDVCIKRKIRNFVSQVNDTAGFDIFIKTGNILNNCIKTVVDETVKDSKDMSDENAASVVEGLCDKYFDIRSFGSVLSTGLLKGQQSAQVRGPVQVGFSRSLDPIQTIPITITRNCVTDEKERNARGEEVENTKGRTMGSKNIIPYGAYICKISVNGGDAKRTGFSQEDLDLLLKSLTLMFDQDKSSARSQMATQKLFVFKHKTELGDAPSNKLFDAIKIQKKPDVKFPRSFLDYDVSVDTDSLLKWSGVKLTEIV
jgi:CRISPR-associated protein Csd2